MRSAVIWLAAATLASASAKNNDCVPAGPDFPSPARLSTSKALANAISSFEGKVGSLGLRRNDTAWAVAVFSSKENRTLYEHYYTPPIDAGVKEVDGHSVFRIGSMSKVFSVWSFLIEAGDCYFNDPITKYVPELRNLAVNTEPDAVYDDINVVRWEDVTLGELASHAAGIARDPTFGEVANIMPVDVAIKALALPTLPKNQTVTCDIPGKASCSRKQMFTYLLAQHPLYATQKSPAYSNIAFTLLNYAQEAIVGKDFSTTVKTRIIDALGMHDSSYETPPATGGVILGNATEVGWDQDLGLAAPSGSFYSSLADMVIAGQAIAQSRLLTPAQTRRWFRPLIQTGYLSSPVGAPWEIRYLTSPDQHLTEVYTKQGDIGFYNTGMAFSPQHDLGFVVLAAGADASASAVRSALFDTFSDVFIPMGERAAQEEATANFNGKYIDEATNSSVTILAASDGRAGLGVSTFVTGGAQIIGPDSVLVEQFRAGQSARLFPSQLRTIKKKKTSAAPGTYEARLGFRLGGFFNQTRDGELEDPCLYGWTAVGAPTYGGVSLDDWVFEMGEDGRAEAVDVRMWRLKMKRVA